MSDPDALTIRPSGLSDPAGGIVQDDYVIKWRGKSESENLQATGPLLDELSRLRSTAGRFGTRVKLKALATEV